MNRIEILNFLENTPEETVSLLFHIKRFNQETEHAVYTFLLSILQNDFILEPMNILKHMIVIGSRDKLLEVLRNEAYSKFFDYVTFTEDDPVHLVR